MSKIVCAAFVLFAAPLYAQEHMMEERQSRCCNGGRDAKPWEGFNEGVKWETSLEAARNRAAEEGKPILLYQLVGDLNQEGC